MRPRSMSARNTSPIRASLADDMPTVYGSARGRGSAAAAANDSASNGRNNERIFMRIFSLFKSAILRSFFLDSEDHRFFRRRENSKPLGINEPRSVNAAVVGFLRERPWPTISGSPRSYYLAGRGPSNRITRFAICHPSGVFLQSSK